MCILCEIKRQVQGAIGEGPAPQEGMRGFNDELKMHFEIHDNSEGFYRIQDNNGEWYLIRQDKIKVLLV